MIAREVVDVSWKSDLWYGGTASGSTIYAYVNNNPVNANDPTGLYPAVVVTLPDGSSYFPMTQVKNPAQSNSYGLPLNAYTAIAVPPNVNPNEQMQGWANTIFQGPLPFGYYWRPGGPNDYKLQNSAFDAYGNFAYGATGIAAGYSAGTLQSVANWLKGGNNNPINTADIQSGIDAIKNGGTLGVQEYLTQVLPASNGFPSLKLAPSGFGGSSSPQGGGSLNTFQMDQSLGASSDYPGAAGGFLIYPNKPNNNQLQSVYHK